MRSAFPQKIFIATFSHWEKGKRTSISGMIEPQLSFFLPKKITIDLLDGPHPGSSNVSTVIEHYKNGSLQSTSTSVISLMLSPLLWAQNKNATQMIFKLRDFTATLEWGFRAKKRYDIFIGLESIYTIAGIILRSLGIVNSVVYYVSDYSPTRYSQTWFNTLYTTMDKFCAKYTNYIWDVSPAIAQGRKKAGLNPKESAPVIIVPNALFPDQISHVPYNKLLAYSLVFAGTLGLENGPDIAIKAIAKLIKKYPNISLHIFGGNEEGKEDVLKNLSTALGLGKHVQFHGFVNNAEKLSKKIQRYMIGLAPYKRKKDSVRAYGDATKLRLYMGLGIPTITTDVPPLGKEIAKKGAAIIVKDNEVDFAKAIEKLFEKDTYRKMRTMAVHFGENNTWENTYKNAFAQMRKN